jgi:tetratricopeptide (TPR) repeat protein
VYSLPQQFGCAIEDADLDEAQGLFAEMERIADRTGISYHLWRVHMIRSFLQLLAGDSASAEASATAAFELGVAMDYGPAYATFGAQLMEIRRQQGRLDEVVEVAQRGVKEYETLPGWNAALAVIYSELGRLDDVRAIVEAEAATGFGGIPRDVTWLLTMASWADCVCDLGDHRDAPVLIQRLAAYSQRVIFTTAHTLGAVGRSLGRLLTLVGDLEGAEIALRDALAVHARLRNPYWTARTQLDLARLLTARAGTGDGARAGELVTEALQTADTYNLGGLRHHANVRLGDGPAD